MNISCDVLYDWLLWGYGQIMYFLTTFKFWDFSYLKWNSLGHQFVRINNIYETKNKMQSSLGFEGQILIFAKLRSYSFLICPGTICRGICPQMGHLFPFLCRSIHLLDVCAVWPLLLDIASGDILDLHIFITQKIDR